MSLNLAGLCLTFGASQRLREKTAVYAYLLWWHLLLCPDSWGLRKKDRTQTFADTSGPHFYGIVADILSNNQRLSASHDTKGMCTMRKDFLVFGNPQIEEDEIKEVVDCLRSGWISTGPRVAQFEELFKAVYRLKTCSCAQLLYRRPPSLDDCCRPQARR